MKKLMIGLALFSLLLAGCGKSDDKKPASVGDSGAGDKAAVSEETNGDEKQRYIDATVEATCLILGSEDLTDPKLEQQSKDIFKKYGFDIEDAKAMEAIATKYVEDKEFGDAVSESLKKCGGDLFKNLGDTSTDAVDVK